MKKLFYVFTALNQTSYFPSFKEAEVFAESQAWKSRSAVVIYHKKQEEPLGLFSFDAVTGYVCKHH